MAPRLLDLFSGAGGCGEGYRRAGFDVTGVDIETHDYPPGEFLTADAMELLSAPSFLAGFDVIHASPPCQHYSTATPVHRRSSWPDLIGPVRALLQAWGGPYVIENVEGARRRLTDPIRLCGSSFGLRVRRHRYFESNVYLTPLPCQHHAQGTPVGIYGDHADSREFLRPDGSRRGAKATSLTDAQDAIGIDWMGWKDLAESVPPVMTEWIGAQLLEALEERAA